MPPPSDPLLQPCPSRTFRIPTKCGPMYVTIVRSPEDGSHLTIFANLGKAGSCAQAQTELACRLVTRALRQGEKLTRVADTLAGLDCGGERGYYHGTEVTSCGDAIALAIREDERLEMQPREEREE